MTMHNNPDRLEKAPLVQMTEDLVLRLAGNPQIAEICGHAVAQQAEGSVCLPLTPQEREIIANSPVISCAPDDSGLFILDGDLLFARRYWKYEQAVRDTILSLASNRYEKVPPIVRDGALAGMKDCQFEGVRVMCEYQLSLLTGGPGTGKTYTIARAVKLIQDQFPKWRLGLAAPTGKAAARVRESMEREIQTLQLRTVMETSTIHTLLKSNYDLVTFKYNHDNPLPLDWLIVDEASMVDLPLMAKLLDALPPKCRLTLVGDANQLASVEPGHVFGDLCNMPELQHCKCELTESSRFPEFNPDGTPGEIFTLSEAVKAGQADKVLAQLKQGTGKLVHYLELDNRQRPSLWPNFQATVERLFAEFQRQTTPEGALLTVKDANGRETRSAPLNDCRLLCAFRHGPYGVDAINTYLRELLGSRCPLPMMITKNEQSLDVSNGDVGVIMPDEPGYLYLPKPDNTVRRIPVELLPDMELAFASTVHKSQGSEFDNVIIVLPPDLDGGDGEALLTREILYTAITRTKKQLFIYAGDKTLRQCCENVIRRQTALLR